MGLWYLRLVPAKACMPWIAAQPLMILKVP